MDAELAAIYSAEGSVFKGVQTLNTRRASGYGAQTRAGDNAEYAEKAERTGGVGVDDAKQNKEASEPSSFGVTPEENKAAKDYVESVLGPGAAVEFGKVLHDKKGKAAGGSGQ